MSAEGKDRRNHADLENEEQGEVREKVAWKTLCFFSEQKYKNCTTVCLDCLQKVK